MAPGRETGGAARGAPHALRVGDHAGHRVAEALAERDPRVEPVTSSYRGYDVWELPPNGQGTAALQILNILEGYDIAAMGFGSPEYLHVLTEAKKLAYEDRAKFYADPQFNNIPLAELLSKEYAGERRALIDLDRARLRAGDTRAFQANLRRLRRSLEKLWPAPLSDDLLKH